MLTSERALPKAVGSILAAATIFATIPSPATAEPVRSTAISEKSESKTPKKTKRKRGWTDPWSHRVATAFAPLPEGARATPAEIAVATAREQLGKPYRYGASGPSAFDCSGLTSFVWRAAGVHLPRSSRAQFSSLRRVATNEMEPGDLVYRPGHIGLYIGDGQMIHSPQSGQRVEIAPLRRIVGAVRPG